jgi:hypothetical protein
MLLVRSFHWLLILAIVYWGMIVLEIIMNLARPLKSNWQLGPRRPGLHLIRLGMIALPIVKALVVRPH